LLAAKEKIHSSFIHVPRGLGRKGIRTHKQSGAEVAADTPAESAEGKPGMTAVVAVVAGQIIQSDNFFF